MWHHGRVTPRDDCEALGYALLEMWLGDAPWVLTTDEEAAAGWSDERLKEMAEKKCTIIHQGFAEVSCRVGWEGRQGHVGMILRPGHKQYPRCAQD
jgi:hypothetical protein